MHSRSKLSVEVSLDDSDVCFVLAVGLDVFVHHTGQFDLELIAIDCCGDQPFADVLCLSETTNAHMYMATC